MAKKITKVIRTKYKPMILKSKNKAKRVWANQISDHVKLAKAKKLAQKMYDGECINSESADYGFCNPIKAQWESEDEND